jgi:hypothetical protein
MGATLYAYLICPLFYIYVIDMLNMKHLIRVPNKHFVSYPT